jgi:hypothetical protein
LNNSNIAKKVVKGEVFSNSYWKNNPSVRVSGEEWEVSLFCSQNKPMTLDLVEVQVVPSVPFYYN